VWRVDGRTAHAVVPSVATLRGANHRSSLRAHAPDDATPALVALARPAAGAGRGVDDFHDLHRIVHGGVRAGDTVVTQTSKPEPDISTGAHTRAIKGRWETAPCDGAVRPLAFATQGVGVQRSRY